MKVVGYGTKDKNTPLGPVQFERIDARDGEVEIEIMYSGVCHSDLHQCADDWENTVYPCVPGHEIVGRVRAVGAGVKGISEGDIVGVGCMVNSCQECDACKAGDEQYCSGEKSCTLTYNGPKVPDGTNTYGGYTDTIVVRQEFVVQIPDALDPKVAAPILCAGVTTYNPMKHFGLKEGQRLAVAGVGGLGHMAVKIGNAMGAHVTALTTSPEKTEELKKIGASDVIVMEDEEALEKAAMSFDLLINTIPYPHDIAPYLGLMKPNTTLVMVGNMMKTEAFVPGPLVFHRIALAGSLIGGIADTQEILDFCAEKGIAPEVEMIQIDEVNKAFERMKNEDVRFRHVIDIESLRRRKDDLLGSAEKIADPDRGAVVGA